MKYSLLALAALVCAGCAGAPQKSVSPASATTSAPSSGTSPFVETCKQTGIQCIDQPITIKLFHKDGSPYGMVLPPPSVVIQGNYVNILAGQTIYVEADVDGDKLANLHLVPSVTHPEKTLVMKLEQVDTNDNSISGGHMMMFTIHNPFGRDLKYHAGIMPLDQPRAEDQVYKTSTCPVMANIMASENWPEPIFQIVVGEFHFPDPKSSEAGTCSN
jgi:hypothetical protein